MGKEFEENLVLKLLHIFLAYRLFIKHMKQLPGQPLSDTLYVQGVQEKLSFFTATPPSPTLLKETFKPLDAMRVYSHSYWLVIFYNQ